MIDSVYLIIRCQLLKLFFVKKKFHGVKLFANVVFYVCVCVYDGQVIFPGGQIGPKGCFFNEMPLCKFYYG